MAHINEKTNENLDLLLIESYLRYGYASAANEEIKRELYNRGYKQMDVIALAVASLLYEDVSNFYRKHPRQIEDNYRYN